MPGSFCDTNVLVYLASGNATRRSTPIATRCGPRTCSTA